MKKIFVYFMSTVLVTGMSLSSCTYNGYEGYLGTMAGAEIGGVIGESIGWMSTSRHHGPGNALLGGIIGTVAGAAIGNAIGNDAADARRERQRRYRQEQHTTTYRGTSTDKAGYEYDNFSSGAGTNALVITNLKYEDEDGDGVISKYETINVIYEVTNTSARNVEVSLVTGNNNSNFEFSPETTTTIEAGSTIRYKAKVFCKSVPKNVYTEIPVYVRSSTLGNASQTLRIRNNNRR